MPMKPVEMKAGDFSSTKSVFGERMPDALITFPFGTALVRQAEVLKIGISVDQAADDPTDERRHVVIMIATDTVSPGGDADGAGFSYMLSQEEAMMLSKRLGELAADMGESAMKGSTVIDNGEARH